MDEPIDYYSYKPLIVPDKPVALVAPRPVHVDRVARLASILTGLPLFLLDRAVEHRVGKDLKRVMLEDGEAVLRQAERDLLPRPLSQRTPPILSLRATTLLDAEVRSLVCGAATVVYLVPEAVDPDLDELLGLISDERVPTRGRHEQRVAQEVLERLGLDVELP